MARPRWLRATVAPLVLPHELGHALPAAAAGLSYTIRLLPEWDGTATPLGQFDAAIDRKTPPWLVQLIAVAPLPLYLSVAGLCRLAGASGPLAVLAVVGCAAAASLSAGDLAVAANPGAAREAGRFQVVPAGWEGPAADLLTVATTVLVAIVLLA